MNLITNILMKFRLTLTSLIIRQELRMTKLQAKKKPLLHTLLTLMLNVLKKNLQKKKTLKNLQNSRRKLKLKPKPTKELTLRSS